MVVGSILMAASIFCSLFMPRLDYLPDGNANFAFGRISVPAGYSIDETLRIAERMEKAARPLWEGKTEPGGSQKLRDFSLSPILVAPLPGRQQKTHHG